MVNPMYILSVFLAGAFLLTVADKFGRSLGLAVLYSTLLTAVGMSIAQIWFLHINPGMGTLVFSAGFDAPLSVTLKFGYSEAIMLTLINTLGVLGAFYFHRQFRSDAYYPLALYLLMLLGANGLVLTRDIFNSFVFMEILSIATYALLGLKQSKRSLAAGFKYMLAGGIASSIYLIGIVFVYRFTGTLNIDQWIAFPTLSGKAYQVALFLLAMGLFIELKPFPANGWALDTYQESDSGMGALLSSINTAALLTMLYKLLPLLGEAVWQSLGIAGLVSFVFANLLGLKQSSAKRLLGYSSTAQTGLIVFVLCALKMLKLESFDILLIALGIFFTNFFAKSGLFWLSGIVKSEKLRGWGVLRKESGLMISFAIFIFALSGFPPSPIFFAKWHLIKLFSASGTWLWTAALLLGSLFEMGYLLRWFGAVIKGEADGELDLSLGKMIAPMATAIILAAMSFFVIRFYPYLIGMSIFPLVGLLIFGLVDFAPVKLKGFALMGILYFVLSQFILPYVPLMGKVFATIFVAGAGYQVFAFMHRKGNAMGYIPLLALLILSLANLVIATNTLEFFIAWELMTLASYLLILKGKKAESAALTYIIFSGAGAYLLLSGLSLMPQTYPYYPLILQASFHTISAGAGILMGLGIAIKLGVLGLHLWLPEAYSQADDDSTALISSVLSKAGVFAAMIILLMLSKAVSANGWQMIALGWVGALTALIGAMMAVFQEDAKKLLAYSSMSQIGYIIMGLSLMSHLGWVSALYLTINHLLFKSLIFMAMAVVFLRTGTTLMYEMGGLIKRLPIAFISVLMGIIAVSGVPPLSGFGSKWFIYTSLIEQGRYLQAGVAFFSSAVAFLYLYRLIHTVFLGQAKPAFKDVKEGPIWLIIPQAISIMLIMGISMFPNLITKLVSSAVGEYFAKPEWMNWDGYNIILSSPVLQGNWNGNLVMYVTMGVFGIPLIWLLLVNAKVQKVKQFNIVFAAERPYKPWTTHFAYNMFAPYNKALGFLVEPRATAFYSGLVEWVHSIAAMLSRLYTGNGQTYMIHIFLYIITLYMLMGVN